MANISQQRRQKMLEFLNKLKQEHQDDDSLRALEEIETELNFNTQLKIKNKLMELSKNG